MDNPGGRPDSGVTDVFPDRAASPSDQLEQKERIGQIRECINALAPEHREVITLRDLEGLSYGEISEVAGISLGTVKSRLARARTDLKNRLEHMG